MIIQAPCKEYVLEPEPELAKIARHIDGVLLQHFAARQIVLRTLSASGHKQDLLQLAKRIEEIGTDRYDPSRLGDRYENTQGRHIDLFGRICTVRQGAAMSLPLLEGFHVYGPQYSHKPAVRMDIWLVYDRAALRVVPHSYAGVDRLKRDGFVFRDPSRKAEALLGIVLV